MTLHFLRRKAIQNSMPVARRRFCAGSGGCGLQVHALDSGTVFNVVLLAFPTCNSSGVCVLHRQSVMRGMN